MMSDEKWWLLSQKWEYDTLQNGKYFPEQHYK